MKIFLLLFMIFFSARFAVSLADHIGTLGWGYSAEDVWGSLGFAAGAGLLWLFFSAIQAFLLAYVRHTYGLEPKE